MDKGKKESTENKKAAFGNHVWLLYSDLNSRFNTLIEECIHLQNTLFGLLPDDFTCEKVFGAVGKNGMRPWRNMDGIRKIEAFEEKRKYYDLDSRHKTFAILIDLLGGLIVGLEKNQCTCQQAYLEFLESHDHTLKSNDDQTHDQNNEPEKWLQDYYRFVSIRGYFIDDGFGFYTKQLEHAHEKLVEVLENFPGKMPQPILMRRWNSAMYEEFLSGYFRSVRWRVRKCIGKLMGELRDGRDYGEEDVLSHSWAHIPTSEIFLFKINPDKDKHTRYGAVRSAFFYLEQPGLFPLLYHECAHNFFPHQINRSFFSSRDDLVRTLNNAFPWPVQNSDWLENFTKEIWLDAISVALGGIPYVAALFSQIFGQHTGEFEISEEQDGVYKLEKLGTDKLRAFNGHDRVESEAYLWVARLKLAVKLCSYLDVRTCSEAEIDWLDSTDCLFEAWQAGGESVYGKEKTSEDHHTLWNFRGKVNDWVVDVAWSYLKIHLDNLSKAAEDSRNYCFAEKDKAEQSKAEKSKADQPEANQPVAVVGLLEVIKKATINYLNNTIETKNPDVSSLDQLSHIDACPIAIRWTIGLEICKTIDSELGKNRHKDWLDVFSKYVRHDGHSGFRAAMEWYMTRDSVFEYIRDMVCKRKVVKDSKCIFKAYKDHKCMLKAYKDHKCMLKAYKDRKCRLRTQNFVVKTRFLLNSDEIDTFLEWLRHRKYGNCQMDKDWKPPLCDVAKEAVELANKIANKFTKQLDKQMDNDQEIPVATLTMGMIYPSEISNPNPEYDNRSPYIAAFNRVFDYISEQTKKLKEVREKIGIKVTIRSTVLPLVSDYSFVHIMRGITPVERSFQPQRLPKMVTKPRTVLHVAGSLFKPGDEGPLFDWGRVKGKVGKVSLIRYKYRFEWLDLLEKLKSTYKSDESSYSLFLSSSWEDVILITCDEGMKEMNENRRALDIVAGGVEGMDAQSCLMLNIDCLEGIEPHYGWDEDKNWEKSLNQNIFNDTAYRRLETLGRYDVTVVFHSEETAASSPYKERGAKAVDHPQQVAQAFARCPKEFWKPIAGYSTSLGIEEKTDDRNAVNQPKFSFISRFVLDE